MLENTGRCVCVIRPSCKGAKKITYHSTCDESNETTHFPKKKSSSLFSAHLAHLALCQLTCHWSKNMRFHMPTPGFRDKNFRGYNKNNCTICRQQRTYTGATCEKLSWMTCLHGSRVDFHLFSYWNTGSGNFHASRTADVGNGHLCGSFSWFPNYHWKHAKVTSSHSYILPFIAIFCNFHQSSPRMRRKKRGERNKYNLSLQKVSKNNCPSEFGVVQSSRRSWRAGNIEIMVKRLKY